MLEGVQVFSEGRWYLKEEHAYIVAQFQKDLAILATRDKKFSFKITGFLILDNSPIVIFPKNFVLHQSSFQADAALLLRTLLRYRMEKAHPAQEIPLLNGNELNSNGRIVSAIALLHDYQNDGFLKRTEKIAVTYASGNTNWPATIHKTAPVVQHGRPIYVDPIIQKNAYRANHIVVALHKAVLSECAALWGWITGFRSDDIVFAMPCSAQEAVRILTAELMKTYASREIDVLRNMIAYLSCKIGKTTQKHIELMATPYFYYVWESICSHVFDNQYHALSKILPQPAWKQTSRKHKIAQRPDILLMDGSGFFILDAKYYDYNDSLPGWKDAVKH